MQDNDNTLKFSHPNDLGLDGHPDLTEVIFITHLHVPWSRSKV